MVRAAALAHEEKTSILVESKAGERDSSAASAGGSTTEDNVVTVVRYRVASVC